MIFAMRAHVAGGLERIVIAKEGVDPKLGMKSGTTQDSGNGQEPMTRSRSTLSMSFIFVPCAVATWALAQPRSPEPGLPTQPAGASPRELRVLGGRTDYSIVSPKKASSQELPTWRIPNIPSSAEAYYASDNYHVIAQTQDPDAVRAPGRNSGALTWIFSDDGKTKWRVNDRGQDACSYFFPDGEHVIFTSTRDNMDFPIGNWSDERNYPTRAWSRAIYGTRRPTPMTIFTINVETGERIQRTHDDWMNWAPYPAPDGRHYVFVRPLVDNPSNWEIFLGDLEGGEPIRLTFNDSFDGFPSISPDGTKMLFSRSEGPGFMSGLYTYVMDISSLNIGPKP
jgi:Tol biopolymer transport system component